MIISIVSCNKETSISDTKAPTDSSADAEKERGIYANKYDQIADVGQYSFPEMTTVPKKYWSCVNVLGAGSRNQLGFTSETEGLQYHLLCQSITGLTNSAVDNGKSDIAVWLYDHENRDSYKQSLEALNSMGVAEQGMQTGIELAFNDYGNSNGTKIKIKDLFDGYVLTDVVNNPESNIVASVASHVYNALIVDVRDKDKFDAAGYSMKYDARYKTTRDSWKEFKDFCNKNAMVIMPVQTGELRDFAIKNKLFVLNINKLSGNSASGQNLDIFEEALKWLDSEAPIYGWEQGVSEDVFVNRASRTGHVWIPSDWAYNITLTSLNYKKRQSSVLAKITSPKEIDFNKKKNFVSFLLTDGDNIQWMMNSFVNDYYNDNNASKVKMGFGIPVGNLSMTSPPWFYNIINKQDPNCTLVETLGGGYSYVDNYGEEGDRNKQLETLAKSTAAFMRQHRIKILGLMAHNVKSTDALNGYKAFVKANDQLEGIVTIQYSPYAGGEGEIYWIKNSNGFEIPVISIKYSIWNHGSRNNSREGTPAFVANKLKSEGKNLSFSMIAVHAWSNFKNIGASNDELAENINGTIKGASAAKLCSDRLGESFEVVNIQELVWRIRMQYKENQTKQYLDVVN